MPGRYAIVSADSHLDANPDHWTPHVPAKWRDRAPRRIRLDDGEDGIVMEGVPMSRIGMTVSTGVPRDQWHKRVMTFDNSAGCGSPEQRVREQDADGVDAEVIFNFVQIRHWRGLKEDDGYAALIHAWNEWLAEDYCSYAPDRLLAMASIPPTNIDHALAELDYAARAGFKGICLYAFPNGRIVPRPEDDRFWAGALDHGLAVTSHAGGTSSRFGPPDHPDLRTSPIEASPAGARTFFRFCGDMAYAPMQLAFAGVFDRFPNLEILWAETNIGWLPYALDQIDDNYERYRILNTETMGIPPLKRKPSEYLCENSLWSFMNDRYGVQHCDPRTIDKIMWSSDFPHSATDWPNSRETIDEVMEGVPADERYKMVAGNAIRFFHLDDDQ